VLERTASALPLLHSSPAQHQRLQLTHWKRTATMRFENDRVRVLEYRDRPGEKQSSTTTLRSSSSLLVLSSAQLPSRAKC
jgi:hypothetical protein